RAYGGRSGNTARTGDAVELQQRWRCATVWAHGPAPGQRSQPCAAIEHHDDANHRSLDIVGRARRADSYRDHARRASLSPSASGRRLVSARASVVLRGVQRAPYDREHLAAGTGHVATTAQFVLPVTSHI